MQQDMGVLVDIEVSVATTVATTIAARVSKPSNAASYCGSVLQTHEIVHVAVSFSAVRMASAAAVVLKAPTAASLSQSLLQAQRDMDVFSPLPLALPRLPCLTRNVPGPVRIARHEPGTPLAAKPVQGNKLTGMAEMWFKMTIVP